MEISGNHLLKKTGSRWHFISCVLFDTTSLVSEIFYSPLTLCSREDVVLVSAFSVFEIPCAIACCRVGFILSAGGSSDNLPNLLLCDWLEQGPVGFVITIENFLRNCRIPHYVDLPLRSTLELVFRKSLQCSIQIVLWNWCTSNICNDTMNQSDLLIT